MARWCAAAGLIAMTPEVALVKLPPVKRMVIFVATLCDRFVNVTTPAAAVAVRVPCKIPLPAARAAVTALLLSFVQRLPNWS